MEILNEANHNLWKEYEEEFEDLPPQYLLGWKKAIEETYANCSSIYYFKEINGKIETVFPFFIVKSSIFGDKIISQPFLDFGGPFGKFDEKFISETILNLKDRHNSVKIEIRLNDFSPDYKKTEEILTKLGFKKESKKNQIIVNLEEENSLWEKFSRITRKGIKKAEKSGLEIREISSKQEIDLFYELYLKKMRDFGTPQHSYLFFENLFKYFGNGIRGLNCYKDGRLIGFLIVLYSKDYMYAAYNASEPEFLIYQPNDLLHWEMIKWAARNKIRYFDIGQCESDAQEGTHAAGIFKFKSKWNGSLYHKFYYHLTQENRSVSDKPAGKSKYDKAIKIWRKLPMPIIKNIGPKIASQLAL